MEILSTLDEEMNGTHMEMLPTLDEEIYGTRMEILPTQDEEMNGTHMEILPTLDEGMNGPIWKYYLFWIRKCMEIIWKWRNALLTSKILAKMDMKLYGNHMEMEKRPSEIKNIS